MSSFDINSQKKVRLGRGLESLLGNAITEVEKEKVAPVAPPAQATTASAGLMILEIAKLAPNPKQPRRIFDENKLQELASSIKEKGILQPIVVRAIDSSRYEIIAGERRWRASKLAGLTQVPVIIKKTDDRETLELALIENLQRDDLNPIEESEAYHRLAKEYMLTQSEIAQKVGKDRATVANSMRLLDLAPPVRELLTKKLISVGHAKVLLSVQDPQRQSALARQIVDQQLSVRASEKLIAQAKPDSAAAAQPNAMDKINISDKLVTRIAEELQKILGTKVSIDYHNQKGKISIHYYSDDELSGLVERLKKI